MSQPIDKIDWFVHFQEFLSLARESAQKQGFGIVNEKPQEEDSYLHDESISMILTADRRYRITQVRDYWENEQDVEKPSHEDIFICLEKLETKGWVKLVASSEHTSNYKDDYYGMWHPTWRRLTELLSEDVLARELFERIKDEKHKRKK